jgi:N-acetylmuramoyl-L-alanine amidase
MMMSNQAKPASTTVARFFGRLALAFLLFLILGDSVRSEGEMVCVEDPDYVTLASVVASYGLSTSARSGPGELSATGGSASLTLRADTRQALINGVRHWLSYPVRQAEGGLAMSRVDVTRTLAPALRPEAVSGLDPVTTVVLDAGHGGHDPGAASPFGDEKDFTLDVAGRVRRKLEAAGLKVVQSRDSDVFIPLEARPAVAGKYPNAIFVSIHFNAASLNATSRRSAAGLEIFAIPPQGAPPTGQRQPEAHDCQRENGHALEPVNLVLATTLYQTVLGRLSSFDRGVKRARFAVLREATVPAVLIEGGFLTEPTEAAQIASASWRQQYAHAIAAGIRGFKRLAEQRVLPRRVTDYGRTSTTEFVPEDWPAEP